MSLISAAGYRKVSLIAESPKGVPAKAAANTLLGPPAVLTAKH
jgi:hypothetical protein